MYVARLSYLSLPPTSDVTSPQYRGGTNGDETIQKSSTITKHTGYTNSLYTELGLHTKQYSQEHGDQVSGVNQ